MCSGDSPFYGIRKARKGPGKNDMNDIKYLFDDGEREGSILCSRTLVRAKIGAPLSNRISTAWSCPLLAAQCSGVSPSWQRRTKSRGYIYSIAESLRMLHKSWLSPWFWRLSEHLCPAAGPPFWCCLSWRPHGEAWSRSNHRKDAIRITFSKIANYFEQSECNNNNKKNTYLGLVYALVNANRWKYISNDGECSS